MQQEEHWTNVYQEKAADTVSWHQPSPEPSLEALERFGASPSSSFIDVGGGASNLVDGLLSGGWGDLTVLDIAAPALEVAKHRLGKQASQVQWIVTDITDWSPTRRYGVWHDRAVFHFLTEPNAREAYHRALLAGLGVGGLVIISTFGFFMLHLHLQ